MIINILGERVDLSKVRRIGSIERCRYGFRFSVDAEAKIYLEHADAGILSEARDELVDVMEGK